MINSKTLIAIASLGDAIQTISTGGKEFDKNIKALKSASATNKKTGDEASSRLVELKLAIKELNDKLADLSVREDALVAEIASSRKLVADAAIRTDLSNTMKAEAEALRDEIVEREKDLKKRESASERSIAKTDKELNAREEVVADHEKKMQLAIAAMT